MEWFVSHQSALEFWRSAEAKDALALKRLRSKSLPIVTQKTKNLPIGDKCYLSRPVHLIVGSGNARKVNRELVCHVDSRLFPNASFVQISPELIVSSPELCFVHLAAELSLIELVTLGFELCGTYRLDKSNTERGFRDDLPLTSVAKLNSYLYKVPGMKGHKNAHKALHFITNGSASPMETILVMLLTLPKTFGGYGLPKPLLNHQINLPVVVSKTTGKTKYYCDLYWPDQKVDVEYDSDAYHATPEGVSRDAIRRNVLASIGVKVVTVSRIQIVSAIKLCEVAKLLSKLLRVRVGFSSSIFVSKHNRLRTQLLPKISPHC